MQTILFKKEINGDQNKNVWGMDESYEASTLVMNRNQTFGDYHDMAYRNVEL